MNLKLPVCPHCRTRLSYIDSFITKNKSICKCPNCGRISVVKILSGMYRNLVLAQIVSIIAFIITLILGGKYCLFGIAVIIIASLFFYGFSPFMIAMNKTKVNKHEENESLDLNKASKRGTDTETEIYSN